MNEKIKNVRGTRVWVSEMKDSDGKEVALRFKAPEIAQLNSTGMPESREEAKEIAEENVEIFKQGLKRAQPKWDDDKLDFFISTHMQNLQREALIYSGISRKKVQKQWKEAFDEEEEDEKKSKSQ